MYYHILSSFDLAVPVGVLKLNYVVKKVRDKIKDLKSVGHSVLFLLDNVDRFATGQEMDGKCLKKDFVQDEPIEILAMPLRGYAILIKRSNFRRVI